MELSEKGFVDDRDNIRYIFKTSDLSLSDVDGVASFMLVFYSYDADTMDFRYECICRTGIELYQNWTNLRDAYVLFAEDLGCGEVELPEDMDNELFN